MSTKTLNPFKSCRRRYLIEFSAAMLSYVAVLLLSRWLLEGPLRNSDLHWAQITVALLPVLPIGFAFIAVVRCLRSMDEMIRRIQYEALAIAGGTTALLAVAYGLIEGPYFPPLSAWWTYTVFMSTWLVSYFIVSWRYR